MLSFKSLTLSTVLVSMSLLIAGCNKKSRRDLESFYAKGERTAQLQFRSAFERLRDHPIDSKTFEECWCRICFPNIDYICDLKNSSDQQNYIEGFIRGIKKIDVGQLKKVHSLHRLQHINTLAFKYVCLLVLPDVLKHCLPNSEPPTINRNELIKLAFPAFAKAIEEVYGKNSPEYENFWSHYEPELSKSK